MSTHSYSRCWIHLTWSTRRREPILPKAAGIKVSEFLSGYAPGKGIYMVIKYVNPEHVHTLVDLPTSYSVEGVVKLLKGASSHWINQNRIIGPVQVGTGLRSFFGVSFTARCGGQLYRQSRKNIIARGASSMNALS